MKTLIKNPWIVTMNANYDIIRNGYVYVEDAEIKEVGKDDVRAAQLEMVVDEVVEAGNMILMPGIVNSHTHMFQTFIRGLADDKHLFPWLSEEVWPFSALMTEDDIYYAALIGSLENLKTGATGCLDQDYVNTSLGNGDKVFKAMMDSGIRGNLCRTFGNYETRAGWKGTNVSILKGGASDANPVFTFIGFKNNSTTEYAMACNLNGKNSAVGKLVSPVLEGGLGKLTFNYGVAYTESNGVSFRVDIKQGGAVVKSFTVTKADAVKYTAYEFSEEVNLKGEFTIEVTNLSPSNSTSNKDRVAIWNMTWTQN